MVRVLVVVGRLEQQELAVVQFVRQQQAGDELGFSVLLPADGTILAVGAGVANRVHDYQWMSNTWEPLGSTLDGEGGGDGFEFSLALSDDGIHFGRGSPV